MEMHHLPRLPRPYYQAFAMVHWTITLVRRSHGWLDDLFHARFQTLLLHTAAREGLFCPIYVLMPDHLHLVWMGMRLDSDQLNAMRFLRTHLQLEFDRRAASGDGDGDGNGDRGAARLFELQKQSHDTVFREQQREHGAFAQACFYVGNNPVRAGLVGHPSEWRWLGAVVPGYPQMNPFDDNYWPLFWRLYQENREPGDPPPLPPFGYGL